MAVKNSKELMFFLKLEYRYFDVADYDLAIRLGKFKKANPIWLLEISRACFLKIGILGFRCR